MRIYERFNPGLSPQPDALYRFRSPCPWPLPNRTFPFREGTLWRWSSGPPAALSSQTGETADPRWANGCVSSLRAASPTQRLRRARFAPSPTMVFAMGHSGLVGEPGGKPRSIQPTSAIQDSLFKEWAPESRYTPHRFPHSAMGPIDMESNGWGPTRCGSPRFTPPGSLRRSGEGRDGIVLRLGLCTERASDASSPPASWIGHRSAHPCRGIAAAGVARAQTSSTDPRERSPVFGMSKAPRTLSFRPRHPPANSRPQMNAPRERTVVPAVSTDPLAHPRASDPFESWCLRRSTRPKVTHGQPCMGSHAPAKRPGAR